MRIRRLFSMFALGAVALGSGCASYSWKTNVPEDMRTISVATFRNDSKVTELGAIVTRQILREVQREGTFTIANRDDAALEIQGEITDSGNAAMFGDRSTGRRLIEYDFSVKAKISVIDRKRNKVLIDAKPYLASTRMIAGNDLNTARRDASGRLADDLARQIIDDLAGRKKWNSEAKAKAEDKAKAEVETDADAEVDADADVEVDTEVEVDVDADAEAEAK